MCIFNSKVHFKRYILIKMRFSLINKECFAEGFEFLNNEMRLKIKASHIY
jgi:hypothetical protein